MSMVQVIGLKCGLLVARDAEKAAKTLEFARKLAAGEKKQAPAVDEALALLKRPAAADSEAAEASAEAANT